MGASLSSAKRAGYSLSSVTINDGNFEQRTGENYRFAITTVSRDCRSKGILSGSGMRRGHIARNFRRVGPAQISVDDTTELFDVKLPKQVDDLPICLGRRDIFEVTG